MVLSSSVFNLSNRDSTAALRKLFQYLTTLRSKTKEGKFLYLKEMSHVPTYDPHQHASPEGLSLLFLSYPAT